MSGAAFGRKRTGPDPDLAARRAAFLAEERVRAQNRPAHNDRDYGYGAGAAERAHRPQKKVGMAYLLWFFLGGFSAHRFYLGFPISATIQLLLSPIGYVMLMSKTPSGFALTGAAALWLLADAILIPGLVNKANDRARGASLAATFA